MSTDGKADGWEQKLIVTFHAHDRDMRDLA